MTYVRNILPDDLPWLPNYGRAQAHFNSVTPFARGNNIGDKPLGKNRKYSRFKIEKGEGDCIRIKHYSTYILTYFADDSLLIDSGHSDTISTCQALQELLGAESFARRKGKVYYKDKNNHFFRTGGGLRVGADDLVSENTPTEKVYKLNRKRFNQVKAKYSFFLNYAKQINTLAQGGRELESTFENLMVGVRGDTRGYANRPTSWAIRTDMVLLRWYSQGQPDLRRRFIELIEKARWVAGEEKQYEAMYPLAQYASFCSAIDWNIQKRLVKTSNPEQEADQFEYTWETTNKRIDKFFGEVLKWQFPLECFDLVEAERGKITHDANRKYIPQTP